MKYRRLTKEQLENLNEEFAQFLASQSIGKEEWIELKRVQAKTAEEELDVFSDIIWEKTLENTQYLEHHSPHHLNLFYCEEMQMQRLVIQCPDKNMQNTKELEWVLAHLNDASVEILQGNKKYQQERNKELFDLIEKGAQLSKGELFKSVKKLL